MLMSISAPQPVVDLAAVELHKHIRLNWIHPEDIVDEYEVRYRAVLRDNDTAWTVVKNLDYRRNYWQLSYAFPGEKYQFEVYSVKNNVLSAAENITHLFSKFIGVEKCFSSKKY